MDANKESAEVHPRLLWRRVEVASEKVELADKLVLRQLDGLYQIVFNGVPDDFSTKLFLLTTINEMKAIAADLNGIDEESQKLRSLIARKSKLVLQVLEDRQKTIG